MFLAALQDKLRARGEAPRVCIVDTVTRQVGVERDAIDYQIQQALAESRGFDLLVMGRPEGAGCYCAANNIIRKYMDKLADSIRRYQEGW